MKHVEVSPITMYEWGMPSVYHPDQISWMNAEVNATYALHQFSHSDKTLCHGLLFIEPAEPVLLDISCDLPVPNAVFLCERHNKKSSSLSLGNHMVSKTLCTRGWVIIVTDFIS